MVGGKHSDQVRIGRQKLPVRLHSGVKRFDGVADAERIVFMRHRVGVLRMQVHELVAVA